MLEKHPLQALFSATHMSTDGRVIAKRPGAEFGEAGGGETLWAEMVKHYIMELGLVVQGDLWPALEIVRLEHRIQEGDFLSIARLSPIVPPGRERLIAKALFAGYDNDFVTAIHILVPQLEHLVRFHLKQVGESLFLRKLVLGIQAQASGKYLTRPFMPTAPPDGVDYRGLTTLTSLSMAVSAGVTTTTLDPKGIENENGLSTLMEHRQANEIFGEDLAFEIRALFCDPFGPNLRNELAHGLIDLEEAQSVPSIYAWWLLLKITFNTFWQTKQRGKGHASEDTEAKQPISE
ncbi:hypothetical protein BOW53_05860 [Solemya pervernicosa gill symbiont]|uniref:DUF4209 domain-containing protein n=1 Tax=Solemya pervernicosa gill symbiont TaxID=642797 RepID=A0A1T2L6X9_9GAMM|nr:DUF4209 domain-containing protein [Solemya pervernicosa gill symbiont]OOZ40859.1 hypothetical protein BOW53_05860 [Solemya pervernicosa gill symbiont]